MEIQKLEKNLTDRVRSHAPHARAELHFVPWQRLFDFVKFAKTGSKRSENGGFV
jgi:hypothetical protein